jgi:isopenicillin-N epimerase
MRRDLPWKLDPDVTHLNHGSFGACPIPLLESQSRWRERMEADAVRFLDDELPGCLADARAALGALLGADPDGLAFVPNATTGVSTVLRSLELDPGDELLTTDHEYNATVNAMRAVAERWGARVVVARVPFPVRGEDEVVERILDAVTPRTRLALISHGTSPTAVIFPIERIVRALAASGIETLVDAAHAPGMVPVDVDRSGTAYWTANGHKWLSAPKGSAVLWVRADRREAIRPLVISHGANDPRVADGRATRFRLEFDWPGTVDPTPYLVMAEAVAFLDGLEPGGWEALMAANHAMVLGARDALATALGIEPPAPDGMLGAMAAVPLPLPAGVEATDELAATLRSRLRAEHRFVVPVSAWPVRAARPRSGAEQLLLRVSAQRYNEPADYERLASVLPGLVASTA